jgi:hypothetical protein
MLETPATPGLEVCCFGHGERRREARKEVTVVLAFRHALRAHEALRADCDDIDPYARHMHMPRCDYAFIYGSK